MFDFAEPAAPTAPQIPVTEAPARPSPSKDARAARLAKFQREQLIVDYLNRGVSVAEIAARIGVGEKRMRAVIREILARRMPAPPREFVAIQVSRLNEALLVAYSAMGEMNLEAVDRVVRIVRELDRYHGFVAAERGRPEPSRPEALAEGTMTFGAALVCRPEIALQASERIESAPGFALAMEAESPVGATREQHPASRARLDDRRFPEPAQPGVCHPGESGGPAAAAGALPGRVAPLDLEARFREQDTETQSDGRPENRPQQLENMKSAPGFATPPDARPTPVPNEPPNLRTARLVPRSGALGEASQDEAMGRDDARPDPCGRSDFPAQGSENVESAPGSAEPDVNPNVQPLAGAQVRHVRMILNGVAAC